MGNLISIVLVAIMAVLGNIAYFEYRFRKERSKEVIKTRLTNLLLPLYFTFKHDEIMFDAWLKGEDGPSVHESEKIERLLESLLKITQENLYLADDDLHEASIQFIEWASKTDSKERFDQISVGTPPDDKVLMQFTEMVRNKYHEARREYIK